MNDETPTHYDADLLKITAGMRGKPPVKMGAADNGTPFDAVAPLGDSAEVSGGTVNNSGEKWRQRLTPDTAPTPADSVSLKR